MVAVVVFPNERRGLAAMGERIRLARERRQLTAAVVCGRAGISLRSLQRVEAGAPRVSIVGYLQVLEVLALDRDLDAIAAEEHVQSTLAGASVAVPGYPPAYRPLSATEFAALSSTRLPLTNMVSPSTSMSMAPNRLCHRKRLMPSTAGVRPTGESPQAVLSPFWGATAVTSQTPAMGLATSY